MFNSFEIKKKRIANHIKEAADMARNEKRGKVADLFDGIHEQLQTMRYTIAIIGHMKRGKSTLLNAMFGRKNDYISPIQSKVCTAAIIHYLDMKAGGFDKEKAFVHFNDINIKPREISFSEIKQYITEDNNPENKKKVRKVEVFGDFPLLNETVTLVDTPGRGTIHDHHETLVDEFLPFVDAIIQPIAADLPLEAGEKAFLKSLSEKQREKVFFVLTKCDDLDEDELNDSIDFVKSNIIDSGFNMNKLYQTSAKPVFDALIRGDDEIEQIKTKNGLTELETDIENFIISKSDKNIILAKRMDAVFSEIKQFFSSALVSIDSQLDILTLDYSSLEQELLNAEKASKELKIQKEKTLSNFEKEFMKKIKKFISKLSNKSNIISAKLEDHFEQDGLMKTLSKSFKLTKLVNDIVYSESLSMIETFSDELNIIIKKLDNELNDEFDVFVKKTKIKSAIPQSGALIGIGSITGIGIVGGNLAWATVAPTIGAWTTFVAKSGVEAGWFVSAFTSAPSTIATAKVAALSTALGTTVTAIATSGGALLALWVSKKIAKSGMTMINQIKLPKLIDEALNKISSNIEKSLGKQMNEIIILYSENIDDIVENYNTKMEELKKAIKNNDPQLKIQLNEDKNRMQKILENNEDMVSEMKILS